MDFFSSSNLDAAGLHGRAVRHLDAVAGRQHVEVGDEGAAAVVPLPPDPERGHPGVGVSPPPPPVTILLKSPDPLTLFRYPSDIKSESIDLLRGPGPKPCKLFSFHSRP